MLKIWLKDFDFFLIDVISFSTSNCFIFNDQIIGIVFALFSTFKDEK